MRLPVQNNGVCQSLQKLSLRKEQLKKMAASEKQEEEKRTDFHLLCNTLDAQIWVGPKSADELAADELAAGLLTADEVVAAAAAGLLTAHQLSVAKKAGLLTAEQLADATPADYQGTAEQLAVDIDQLGVPHPLTRLWAEIQNR
jgi:hypothetical protein